MEDIKCFYIKQRERRRRDGGGGGEGGGGAAEQLWLGKLAGSAAYKLTQTRRQMCINHVYSRNIE